MKTKKMIVSMICFIIMFLLQNVQATQMMNVQDQNISQKVPAVVKKDKGIAKSEDAYEGANSRQQNIVVEILSGEKKGKEYTARYDIMSSENSKFKFDKLKVGDKVYLTIDENHEETMVYVSGVQRQNSLLILGIIFLLAILILGRMQGVKTIISLFVTVGMIFYWALPKIVNGSSPILVTLVVCAVTTIVTYLLISGFTKKTLASSIGTVGGVLVAGLIAIIFSNISRLSGFNEESMYLPFLPQGINFDLIEILISGILIGALGACMDVSISIASAIKEIKTESPKIDTKGLFKSGMNIGKDVMGTMTNTLILAYVGSSITLLILYMGYNMGVTEIVNIEAITEAIIRSLAGSLGLIAVIPITALISSLLYGKENLEE